MPNCGIVSVITLPLEKIKKTQTEEQIATWLGSCSTSPPCGSSKNPTRYPCGGQETSWPHSLGSPKRKTGRDGAGVCWRGWPLHHLGWSNLETGSDSLIASEGRWGMWQEEVAYTEAVVRRRRWSGWDPESLTEDSMERGGESGWRNG